MTRHPERAVSRRNLLRATTAAAATAAGGPLLSSCTTPAQPTSTPPPASPTADTSWAPGAANVRVSNDHYGVHVEPSVATNPHLPGQLLAACQVSPSADPEFIGTYVSNDQGVTWQSGGVPNMATDKAHTGNDVTVAFDAQGRGYLCAMVSALSPRQEATSDRGDRSVSVWRTDDGGRTFSPPATLAAGKSGDHPWLATGTGPGSSQRSVYLVWSAGDRLTLALAFSRSTDGGQSFDPPRTILAQEDGSTVIGSGPVLAAGPTGLVCAVFGRTARNEPSGDVVSQVVAVCSPDGGQTFGPAVTLGPESSIISLPGGAMPVGSPAVAVGPDGAIYVAFTSHHPAAAHSDIVATASHDGGRTWSQPTAATPADGVSYFQPNLIVDEAGRLAISAFALSNGRVDVVLLVTPPGQLEFGPPTRVTNAAFDPAHSPTNPGKHGLWWIGDYQGIASTDQAFHLVWNDTRTGRLELFAATVGP